MLLLLACLSPQAPLSIDHDLTVLTIDDGLPAGNVRTLCYDDRGVLYVGTSGGLATYDGARFRKLLASETPGLGSDRILTLHQRNADEVWVGAHLAPPTVLRGGTFDELCDGRVLNSVTHFVEGGDGSLWMTGHRLARLAAGELRVYGPEDGLGPDAPIQLVVDAEGVVWTADARAIRRGGPGGSFATEHEVAARLFCDAEGVAWAVAEGRHVFALGRPDLPATVAPFQYVYDTRDSRAGRVLAADTGVYQVRRVAGGPVTFEPLSVRDGGTETQAVCVLPAQGHDLWVGTSLSGLEYHQLRFSRVVAPPDAFVGPVQMVHSTGDGNALVSYGNLPEHHLLGPGGSWSVVRAATDDPFVVQDVVRSGETTWVATTVGVGRLVGTEVAFDDRLRGASECFACLQDGSVWALVAGVVRRVDRPEVAPAAPGEGILGLIGRGDTLLATRRGAVLRLAQDGGRWEAVADLEGATPRCLRLDERGDLWISTYGSGLLRLRAGGALDRWSTQEGLADDFLGWIAPIEGDEQLWINGNTGVQRISRASLDRHALGQVAMADTRAFHAPEGNGPHGARLGDGSLVLPTVEGVTLFDRRRLPPADRPPVVHVERPLVDGAPLDPSALPIGEANLRVPFTAPVYPTRRGARLQYRLVELEEPWNDLGEATEVRLPRLRDGDYTVELRARTPASGWSDPVRAETVTIEAHWYQTRWGKALLVVGALLTGLALAALRMARLQRHTRALEGEIRQRNAAEAALRTSEERFRYLFHTAPSAIVSWNPFGRVIDRNARADTLFGWRRPDRAPSPPWDLFETPELGRAAFSQVLETGTDTSITATTRVDGDKPHRCRWHLAPLLDTSGGVTAVIAVVIDLDRQQRSASQVTKLREKLVAAEESERSRIARELHDDLSQRLAALAMEVHAAEAGGDAAAEPQGPMPLAAIRDELQTIARDVHALSRQLHPTIVDDLGLTAALRSECARRSRLTALDVHLRVQPGLEDPPRGTALALFRIAQEALRNAVRHSGAREVRVVLERDGDAGLALHVVDDGRGFDLERADGGGIGVDSMRERATLAGGTLEVSSTAGQGTRITVRVPVRVATA